MEKVWKNKDFTISTNKEKLNVNMIYEFLSNSYWAKNRTLDQVKASINNSICFGLFNDENQIGFARVITDKITFAYLADVFIEKTYQRLGLGKWMIDVILNCEDLKNITKWMLRTADAHGLYEQFGFKVSPHPERTMSLEKK